MQLTDQQLKFFHANGYLLVRKMAKTEKVKAIQNAAYSELNEPNKPWELETHTGYPGAPTTENEIGGGTVRRLLGAVNRQLVWRDWAIGPQAYGYLSRFFDDSNVYLSTSHHNCLMTKKPEFSSDTGWHQDIRYWSFDKPELISMWLALGDEAHINGCLSVIPGSHLMSFESDQFDDEKFFRANAVQNVKLLKTAVEVELSAGDVLFFDCRLLHSATRNHTNKTKLSLVFTYRKSDNAAIKGSRSAAQAEILLEQNN